MYGKEDKKMKIVVRNALARTDHLAIVRFVIEVAYRISKKNTVVYVRCSYIYTLCVMFFESDIKNVCCS